MTAIFISSSAHTEPNIGTGKIQLAPGGRLRRQPLAVACHSAALSVFEVNLIFLSQLSTTHFCGQSLKPSKLQGRTQMLLKHSSRLVLPQVIAGYPVRKYRIAPEIQIRRVGVLSSPVEGDLAKARTAFRQYQSSRRRGAIFDYLQVIFGIVRRWTKEHRTKASSHQALTATGRSKGIRNLEPFAIAICCTSDPRIVDPKTRNKWSRALRYAERYKPDTQSLSQFIKSQGGINEVAARFSKYVSS
jgi:hypothetical protein